MLVQTKIQKKDLKCLLQKIDLLRFDNDTKFLKTMRDIISDIYITQSAIQILKKPKKFVDEFILLMTTIDKLANKESVEPYEVDITTYREVK